MGYPLFLPYKKPPAVDVSILPQEVFLFQCPFLWIQFSLGFTSVFTYDLRLDSLNKMIRHRSYIFLPHFCDRLIEELALSIIQSIGSSTPEETNLHPFSLWPRALQVKN